MAAGVTARSAAMRALSARSCNVGLHSAYTPSSASTYTPLPPDRLGTINSKPPRSRGRTRAPIKCGVVYGTTTPRSMNVLG